jgi:hypothetical protein
MRGPACTAPRLQPRPATVYDLAGAAARIDALGPDLRVTGEPDDTRQDNLRRAGWAATAVVAFAARCSGPHEPLDEVVSDLIGDLMHLADAIGLSYAELESRGRRHYLAELGGRP